MWLFSLLIVIYQCDKNIAMMLSKILTSTFTSAIIQIWKINTKSYTKK